MSFAQTSLFERQERGSKHPLEEVSAKDSYETPENESINQRFTTETAIEIGC